MIIDDITQDDVIAVLDHVKATCALKGDCVGCPYRIPRVGCAFAYLPERWLLDDLIRNGGDQDAVN